MKVWTLDDYIKFTFDCLATPKDRCKYKWFKDDNFHDEDDFEECYGFVVEHKFYFYDLFAKSLKRNHPEEFN